MSGPDPVARARAVLLQEAEALQRLAAGLDGRFAAAAAMVLACRGKVCCAGLGKTGLVMRKVAATLASTGTPAIFVHAAEALHGDLGIFQAGDLLLVASHSGQTPESVELALRCRERGVPVLAICRSAERRLGRAADLCLPLPVDREACLLDLAPTTSTTALMALGDALAVAVMEQRGVGVEQFTALHPAGSLGLALRRVGERMAPAPLIDGGAPVTEIPAAISAGGLGLVGVVGAGGLVGCVTDGDLRRLLMRSGGRLEGRAAEIMHPAPACIGQEARLKEAQEVMHARRITALFVTATGAAPDRAVVGVLHIHHLSGI